MGISDFDTMTKAYIKLRIRKSLLLFCFSFLVLCLAYITYFRSYWYPPLLFWDENYRVVSAFQYLHHVMFMEYHPPLGKLFIALGEYLFHPNQYLSTDYFLSVDFIRNVPPGFSFVGVRFFPVLFATVSAVLFFFILFKISKRIFLSYLFSSLYLFDNALIVHSRGANLDSIQIFFVFALILYFLSILDFAEIRQKHYFIGGILTGLVVSVKLNGLVFVYLLIALLYFEIKHRKRKLSLLSATCKVGLFFFGLVVVFSATYYIHGALGQQVINNRYFSASDTYKKILATRQAYDPLYLPLIIRDNLVATKKFGDAIPKYDPIYEAGRGTASLPYTWPISDKSIAYLWGMRGDSTQYLYLIGNPIIWSSGLLGIVLSTVLIVSVVILKKRITNGRLFFLLQTFFVLYVLHMLLYLYLSLQRILFLYVYFIPLLISFILLFITCNYTFEKAILRKDRRLYGAAIFFVILIIFVFWFFSPLTYFQLLTKKEFLMRSWFPFWHLTPR